MSNSLIKYKETILGNILFTISCAMISDPAINERADKLKLVPVVVSRSCVFRFMSHVEEEGSSSSNSNNRLGLVGLVESTEIFPLPEVSRALTLYALFNKSIQGADAIGWVILGD